MLKKANEPLFSCASCASSASSIWSPRPTALPDLSRDRGRRRLSRLDRHACRPRRRARKVDEVFEFVVGDCELEIVDLTPAGTDFRAPTRCYGRTAAGCRRAARRSRIHARAGDAGGIRAVDRAGRSRSCCRSAGRRGAQGKARNGRASRAATTIRVELEQDRPRRQHGRRACDRAGDARPDRAGPAGRTSQPADAKILDEVVHHTRELKDSVMSMRAQPVGSVFQRMPRLVRELSTKTDKKVDWRCSARPPKSIDSIIERLGDPLTHIIRNSVDHGIESPADRARARQDRGGHHSPLGRASRRPHRHRDRRRRRRHQFRARAEEGTREGAGRCQCQAHR